MALTRDQIKNGDVRKMIADLGITIVEAIISDRAPQGWASLMVAVLVLAGVQLLVIGMIGEYLGSMFLAVNRKPQYLVREVFRRGPGPGGLDIEQPKVDTRAAGQPHREPSHEPDRRES